MCINKCISFDQYGNPSKFTWRDASGPQKTQDTG